MLLFLGFLFNFNYLIFLFSSPIPDTRVKMDANRLKWRKLIFRHSLVGKVREAHSKFLEEKKCFNFKFLLKIKKKFLVEFDDNQNLHPEFKKSINELVGDILTDGAIPSRPKSCGANLQTTDIRMFLKVFKNILAFVKFRCFLLTIYWKLFLNIMVFYFLIYNFSLRLLLIVRFVLILKQIRVRV